MYLTQRFCVVALLTSLLVGFGGICHAADDDVKPALPDSWSKQIQSRSVGPANMSGRITSIAVYEKDKNIWWAASASGGLLKTTNNGISFEHQFDKEATVSIGDVQVSKTDPNIVWVGTGEANPRNSVSWGDGVYKSVDGGKTWKNMGLKKTFQTGRIAIHPEDHDTVYVGSLGRLWGPNEERGLFKTTDGGKTWEKIFYVDDKTGVVDVQMNPNAPDELLIATYERMRDGFDGNDPMTKYGAGSGIYKTIDGGKSFTRISKGLPTCNLGRIGLCYYLKNPNFVAAIVESENIAKQPKDAGYAGLRGENADVGAKINQVVEDGPAAKAGLKLNDIVISVDGTVIHSYNDLLAGMRKRKLGETVKLVVSRDRKPVDIAIELGKQPQRGGNNSNNRRRTRRTPFTGTLGGQAANLQGQQGDNEHEYGGVYLSKDGGDSWERINTLNPRPMYYSQIRIDPSDRKNMYVLGTSLYRSTDGGKTFTGDGGRGIHPDNHALWIDPDDSRHMILGNDGGLYVSYDRMDNWDHHNHVAIGQFYHAGIGPRLDYKVYGGLQDNGSWGGPVRAANDSGTINTDWFRVGGGDGFITLVDPEDADQIYFESQNGAMGRINLRTGDRGFIRPRPPRGTRYRFNWKTPFILSPHNSRIHYSAGNHVFRSFNRGAGVEAISDEITNTNKGAGSAISESPVKAGVIYVGTTDGAVWMTKDGGKEWTACFSQPKKADESKDGDDKDKSSSDKKESTADSSKSSEKTGQEESAKKSKSTGLDGVWNGEMTSDRFPQGQAPSITFSLKADPNGKVTGEIETRRGPQTISSGRFDAKTGQLELVIESERGSREFSAKVDGSKMSGEMSGRGGRFQIEFEAEKQEDPGKGSTIDSVQVLSMVSLPNIGLLVSPNLDDPVSGSWKGVVRSEQIPNGELEFEIELKLGDENLITGTVRSPQGRYDIEDGQFKPKSGKLYFTCENERVYLDFEGKLDGDSMNGDVAINDSFTVQFEGTRVKAASSSQGKKQEDESTSEAEAKSIESTTDEMPSQEQTQTEQGFLGIQLSASVGAQLDSGFEISNVIEDTAAEKAGLQVGDVVKEFDGDKLESLQQFVNRLRGKQPGTEIELLIDRDGEKQELKVVLGSRPSGARQAGNRRPGRAPETQPDSAGGDASEKPSESVQEEQASASDIASSTSSDESSANDPVSGVWEGTIDTPQGGSELKLELKFEGPKKITGTYETTRSDGTITEGSYDAEKEALTLVVDNDRFTLDFNGKLSKDTYAGEIEFNGGTFSMDFEAKRTGQAEVTGVAATEASGKKGPAGESLEDLMPGPRWVSSLHASKFEEKRCYVTFDGHRSNDDLPHLFVTEDYGKTWQSLRGNLPDAAGSARVLREDLKNENVLYLGCEFGAWVSIDRGATWTRLGNLPTVAVHEFAQHPTLDDVVVATHGRSLWVVDVCALRQIKADAVTSAPKLYQPRDVIVWRTAARRGSSGTRKFVAANSPIEAAICYSLGSNARSLEIEIRNLNGEVVKRFEDLNRTKGLHSISWDLRRGSAARGRGGRRMASGDYLISMYADGQLQQTKLTVKADPDYSETGLAEQDEIDWWLENGRNNDR